MPIVGVSDPDELGGRMFKTDDGAELYFYGPEAEALAADIGRQPDMRTASRSALGLSSFGATPGPAPGQPTMVQQTTAGPVAVTGSTRGVHTPEAPKPPPMRQLPGTAQPAPAAAAPAGPEMVTVPGSPGVDPQRLIDRGVMVPTGETVSEAIPIDDELEQLRQETSINEQLFQQRRADVESRKQYAQSLQAAAALPELEMRAAEQQHAARQVEQLYERERADIGAMLDEHRAKKVDPNRYWTNKSGFGQVMTGLSVLLGAFASGISGVHGTPLPNVALEQLNREIERDIALQQEEIEREGVNSRNALALLQHRFGDMQQAKDALKLAMHDVADMQAKELMFEFGSQEAVNAYDAWHIEHQKEREALERKIRDASVGKYSRQFKFTQPVAPSGGGRVPFDQLPLAQQVKIRKQQAELAKSEATVRGGGVDPDVAAKAGAKREEKAREDTRDLGKALAETEEAQGSFDATLAAAGLRFNRDTGQVEGYTGDIPGVGLFDQARPDLLAGERGRLVRQNLRNTVDRVMRARTGAAAPAEEIEKMEKFIIGSGTEQDFLNGMRMLQGELGGLRDMHRARFGQGAVGQLERNRADVERARTDKAKAAELEPY